jgi:hypothetical protein
MKIGEATVRVKARHEEVIGDLEINCGYLYTCVQIDVAKTHI